MRERVYLDGSFRTPLMSTGSPHLGIRIIGATHLRSVRMVFDGTQANVQEPPGAVSFMSDGLNDTSKAVALLQLFLEAVSSLL